MNTFQIKVKIIFKIFSFYNSDFQRFKHVNIKNDIIFRGNISTLSIRRGSSVQILGTEKVGIRRRRLG